MNRIIIFILLSSIWQLSFCQKESSFWYFGENSGLHFSGDNPIPTRGMLNTDEGCAAISDSEGNLLFYTDGTVIYNKEHKLMQNGEGLLGHTSSTQSSIIVPMASSEGVYYIFTVDGLTGESKGVHYSVVDMALDSGLGAVEETAKNTFLLSTQGEKLTAVQTQNGRGVWVITYSESYEGFKFFSYLINENGLNPNPVVSEVSQSPGLVGYLKASTKGDRLATAGTDVNGFMLFDYDNESGIVSNQRHIDSPMLTGHGWFGPYGIEFSPSGQIIYVSHSLGGL
ncbi:MAG: hypothetical protein R3213_01100, partial [Flavobacteriaceae bacterium]|nr:hypothetical protein [Flavobacteriaceae bacterium]